jgi:hypothetical protein
MWGSHFSEENCVSLASLLHPAARRVSVEEVEYLALEAVHLTRALINNHSFNPIGDIAAAALVT